MTETPSNRPAPIRSVKGTRDLLPRDTALWQKIEEQARAVFSAYHFGEIRTPILEQTALFARSVGQDTDIVGKEMYMFVDQERPDLAGRRYWLAGMNPGEVEPEKFKSFVASFVADLRTAMHSGQVPKSPGNERILDEVQANLGTTGAAVHRPGAPAGGDPEADKTRTNLYWGLVRQANLTNPQSVNP